MQNKMAATQRLLEEDSFLSIFELFSSTKTFKLE